ncbi:sigma-70 family RNA polymerase sigma factor [Salinibacterium sp. SYSU T00001]|uniref:sigma-70 family RNA polymerase sigma factor n=1 Tax=Homoserinimonas sedimenticola TaxID=2986805 RepID=UPI00223666B6|nr:sigma-70 family RNA polymerase sigma factor [Salinibacterium sedimenticola]MCW4385743.1 sigma-70 family RNA polymerase sigma factor [Salinibacterium sedimenticola]
MDRSTRNALVVENLPLVGYLVSELCARASHLSRDDLASAGAVGLITAAESFKPELGIPFGAYARKRILGAFSDEMRSEDWASRGTRRRIKETLAVEEKLTAALGRTPAIDEVAQALGVDRTAAQEAMADAARHVTTLDDITAGQLVAETVLPEEQLLEDERTGFVRSAVDVLPEKMRHIITAIYFEDRTVKEVAEELGITHSAVSQQRSEAIRLLRDGMNTHFADDESPREPESRISAASRSAYLARLADQAFSGMSRMAAAPAPFQNSGAGLLNAESA